MDHPHLHHEVWDAHCKEGYYDDKMAAAARQAMNLCRSVGLIVQHPEGEEIKKETFVYQLETVDKYKAYFNSEEGKTRTISLKGSNDGVVGVVIHEMTQGATLDIEKVT